MVTITLLPISQPVSEYERNEVPDFNEIHDMIGGSPWPLRFPDDPNCMWHVGFASAQDGILNVAATRIFNTVYPGIRIFGHCILLEDMGLWWRSIKTGEPCRKATREECLAASCSEPPSTVLDEDGVQMILTRSKP